MMSSKPVLVMLLFRNNIQNICQLLQNQRTFMTSTYLNIKHLWNGEAKFGFSFNVQKPTERNDIHSMILDEHRLISRPTFFSWVFREFSVWGRLLVDAAILAPSTTSKSARSEDSVHGHCRRPVGIGQENLASDGFNWHWNNLVCSKFV